MIEHAGHAKDCGAEDNYSFVGWNYNFRSLDLVNYNDGNAWVATASPITIYWPYPEEALSDPDAYEYQILHYRRMSRSYAHKALTNIDAWEEELLHNGEKGAVKIVKETLQYHEKEKGISFTLEYTDGTGDNFSPFVLMWKKKGTTKPDVPDEPDGPSRPVVTPTPTPSATPAPTPTVTPSAVPSESPVPSPTASPQPSGSPEPGPSAAPETSPAPVEPSAGPSAAPTSAPASPSPSAPGGSPQGPKLPQTGQNWWPVLLMGAAGIVLLFLGLNMGKPGKGKHEA